MAANLVIVESPAKAKTIKKYLGKGFDVLASYGHVRDLIPKEGAVDPSNQFAMRYEPIDRNKKHLDAIVKATRKADAIYLAPDPDREGEAIAWHIAETLKEKKVLKDTAVYRVAFNQITKKAIQEAVQNPRDISMDLVNAQQARRALDYLVGFTLSPLLWRKIRAGLSAGRVQSPALRMIVEREIEIENFVTQEYWTIHATTQKDDASFESHLTLYQNEKVEQFSFKDEKSAAKVQALLEKEAGKSLTVGKVVKRQRKRNPTAPFITSTLQQEAARKLGFSAQRTMQVAQQLYEGIDIGEGSVGLITYMRTDSVSLAEEAVTEIREAITKRFGKENLPDTPPIYKTKSKNAQEAHEAIRPTSAFRHPEEIKAKLSPEQFKLYNLIWKRTMASQMIPATLDTVAADLWVSPDNQAHVFRANGSIIVDPGFMSVYQEGADDKKEESHKLLPPLEEGQSIDLEKITPQQHFTDPPPRYTEASLVKALEEHDIGRPSTYASIISTLKNRKYVEMDSKRFKATDVGRVVSRFLVNYFNQIVDYAFTANLENQLDAIARGEAGWIPLMESFWTPFKSHVEETDANVKRSDVTQERIDEKCPKCSEVLAIRLGRRGRFIGCTAYPDCDYTRNLDGDGESSEPEIIEGRECPTCKAPLVAKHGRYGKFIGCTSYPDCNYMEPFEKPKDTGVKCPKCNEGTILQRKSRRGKIFYSCERYPKCDYAIWNEPLADPCPQCNWPITAIKVTKRAGTEIICPQKECGYKVDGSHLEQNKEEEEEES